MLTATQLEDFWSKIDATTATECWNWKGTGRSKAGYGFIQDGKKLLYAHRVAYEFTFDKIPDGLQVRHKCDNPSCCNPYHLLVGTQADNMRDKVERGRQNRGENHGRAKLSTQKVKQIKKRLEEAELTMACISKEFGVTIGAISAIKTGRSWGWLK